MHTAGCGRGAGESPHPVGFPGRSGCFSGQAADGERSRLACGAVTIQRVAQDGMRVRAHARTASFRRKAKLQTSMGPMWLSIGKIGDRRRCIHTGKQSSGSSDFQC